MPHCQCQLPRDRGFLGQTRFPLQGSAGQSSQALQRTVHLEARKYNGPPDDDLKPPLSLRGGRLVSITKNSDTWPRSGTERYSRYDEQANSNAGAVTVPELPVQTCCYFSSVSLETIQNSLPDPGPCLVNVAQHEPLKLGTPEIKWLAPEPKGESSWFWSVGNVLAQSVLPKACTPEVRSIFQLDPQDLVDIEFHATILQMQGELGKLGLLSLAIWE